MNEKEFEKRVDRLMQLGIYTLEECKQLVIDDEKVDHNEPLPWDLTKEEKANQKKALSTGTRKQSAPVKRVKKENPTKKLIIQDILNVIRGDEKYERVEVLNDERQIAFIVDDLKFELTLTQKRKGKE